MDDYRLKRSKARVTAEQYDRDACNGDLHVIYNFGKGIIEDHEIQISGSSVSIENFAHSINLDFDNPYSDMIDA